MQVAELRVQVPLAEKRQQPQVRNDGIQRSLREQFERCPTAERTLKREPFPEELSAQRSITARTVSD